MAKDKAQQAFFDELFFQQHLRGVDFGKKIQGKRDGIVGVDETVQKSDLLVGQVEEKVGIGVFEGKNEVIFVGQPFEAETAFFVGFGDIIGGCCHRQRVELVAVGGIKTHIGFFNGLLVIGVEHHTSDGKRVDVMACGKAVNKVFEDIALVQVFDGFAEVDGIGRVGLQGFLKPDNQCFAFQFNVGFSGQGGRKQHVLVGIFKGNVFVEADFNFLSRKGCATVFGHRFHDHRWCGVFRSARGCHSIGATLQKHGHEKREKP